MTELHRHHAAPPAHPTNPLDFDFDELLDLDVLTQFTLKRQRAYTADEAVFQSMLATFQKHYRSQVITGDGSRSAARRSRRMERHIKALITMAVKSGQRMESLRTSVTSHEALINALPAQREAKALRRSGRRAAVVQMTTKSLHKSATSFAPAPQDGTAAIGQDTATRAPAARGITDLWDQQQRRGA
ncbi:hypothetical protein [Streptomyces sp. NBC_00989]|uniref:hypothetical protein n=1 Tax=Streptomyces sp. NBC_00989 TaxID=2903705 RepID=UPI00386F4EE3|nr:hypothetical protein OG714_38215 [Streptomyces sp. NBC_00989]